MHANVHVRKLLCKELKHVCILCVLYVFISWMCVHLACMYMSVHRKYARIPQSICVCIHVCGDVLVAFGFSASLLFLALLFSPHLYSILLYTNDPSGIMIPRMNPSPSPKHRATAICIKKSTCHKTYD